MIPSPGLWNSALPGEAQGCAGRVWHSPVTPGSDPEPGEELLSVPTSPCPSPAAAPRFSLLIPKFTVPLPVPHKGRDSPRI